MSWSISQAAKEAGLSKSTISRAIKAGRISASRQDDGAYPIEPAGAIPGLSSKCCATHTKDAS